MASNLKELFGHIRLARGNSYGRGIVCRHDSLSVISVWLASGIRTAFEVCRLGAIVVIWRRLSCAKKLFSSTLSRSRSYRLDLLIESGVYGKTVVGQVAQP